MKKKAAIIFITIVFLLGIGVMSYPLISSVVNNIGTRNEASSYQKKSNDMPSGEVERLIKEARKYNESLTHNMILTDPFDIDAYENIGANYETTLDIDGSGLIGYVNIPKINVYLPIFHGTSYDVLSKGAGHLANTSLPVGGKNTHSVISAHTAFPTNTFFDYLTDLEKDDVFYIHILNQTLKYQVDQIKVVLPTDTSDLYITDGEDYVTLLTCTPYSINTHRLLVRGTRVPYNEEEIGDVQIFSASDGSIYFIGYKIPYWVAGTVLGAFILVVVLIIFIVIKRNKRKNEQLADKVQENIT
ncbi:MAG: class C sortase [Oscillospiraceae bacterium]|nr:class C sortase [Oscillospiraceae bacterium]